MTFEILTYNNLDSILKLYRLTKNKQYGII